MTRREICEALGLLAVGYSSCLAMAACSGGSGAEDSVGSVGSTGSGSAQDSFLGSNVGLDSKAMVDEDWSGVNVDISKTSVARMAGLVDELYKEAGTGSNVIISPFSLTQSLAMLAEGAAAETLEELQAYLGTDLASLEAKSQPLSTHLSNLELMGTTLLNAQGIWHDVAVSLLADYEHRVKEYFRATIREVDFDDEYVVADDINAWVNEQTQGKISELVDASNCKGMSMVLANAVYLKAAWLESFDKDLTEKTDFSCADGVLREVDMMKGTAEEYLLGDHAYGFVKYYEDGQLGFAGIVPDDPESNLADIDLYGLLTQRPQGNYCVDVWMPRLHVEFATELSRVLREQGLEVTLSDKADFSAMGEGPLRIDSVIQKVYFDVDEELTEAAAATGFTFNVTSVLPADTQRVEVHLDRPFFLCVWDKTSGELLFVGKVGMIGT